MGALKKAFNLIAGQAAKVYDNGTITYRYLDSKTVKIERNETVDWAKVKIEPFEDDPNQILVSVIEGHTLIRTDVAIIRVNEPLDWKHWLERIGEKVQSGFYR